MLSRPQLMGVLGGLVCLTGLWLGLTAPVLAQASSTPPTQQLRATGQGTVLVETSVATLRLGVEVQGESASDVQAEVARQTNQLVERLQELDVQDLQTLGISLLPQFDYVNGRQVSRGVQGQNLVQCEVAIAEAGAVLDAAVAVGATRIEGISFRATDEVLQAGRQQALRQAVEDARDQATTVLAALGLQEVAIAGIEIESGQTTAPPQLLETAALRSDFDSTPVLGGDQAVTARVVVNFRYTP